MPKTKVNFLKIGLLMQEWQKLKNFNVVDSFSRQIKNDDGEFKSITENLRFCWIVLDREVLHVDLAGLTMSTAYSTVRPASLTDK